MKKFFITGVDTDIGKTFVCNVLALYFTNKGLKTGYFKPFQSGAYLEKEELKAPDIVEINKYSNIKTGYSYLLKGEVSPYLASKLNNIEIDLKKVQDDINNFSQNLDIVLIEGAGGFYCPIDKNVTFADFIKILNVPTIFVTTPFLGRINHTLMTIDCAINYNINIKGIIINNIPQNPSLSEKYFIEELKNFCKLPIIAEIEKIENINKDAIINLLQNINL